MWIYHIRNRVLECEYKDLTKWYFVKLDNNLLLKNLFTAWQLFCENYFLNRYLFCKANFDWCALFPLSQPMHRLSGRRHDIVGTWKTFWKDKGNPYSEEKKHYNEVNTYVTSNQIGENIRNGGRSYPGVLLILGGTYSQQQTLNQHADHACRGQRAICAWNR